MDKSSSQFEIANLDTENNSRELDAAQTWGFLLGPGLAILVFFICYLFLPATKFPATESHEKVRKDYLELAAQLGIEVDHESCRFGGKQSARRYYCHVSIHSELQMVEKMEALSWTRSEKKTISSWGRESGQEYRLSKDAISATIGCQHAPEKAFCYFSLEPNS